MTFERAMKGQHNSQSGERKNCVRYAKRWKQEKHASVRELFVTGPRIALLVGIGLALFQEVIGTGVISYYATTIFQFELICLHTPKYLCIKTSGIDDEVDVHIHHADNSYENNNHMHDDMQRRSI